MRGVCVLLYNIFVDWGLGVFKLLIYILLYYYCVLCTYCDHGKEYAVDLMQKHKRQNVGPVLRSRA